MSNNGANYQKRYDYDRARGVYRGYVDATPVRHTITELLAAGYTATAIGRATGLPHATITGIADGRPRIWQATHRAAANLTHANVIAATTPNGRVPRTGAIRRVRALQAIGWTMPLIAAHAGLTTRQVARVVDGWAGSTINKRLHDAIAGAFTELAMTPGPDPRCRTIATRRGWAPPLAWPDDIDDPAATPDLGAPNDRRGGRRFHIDDLEHLLDHGGPFTWDGITARLGVTKSAIEHACSPRRGNRPDLLERIQAHHEHHGHHNQHRGGTAA